MQFFDTHHELEPEFAAADVQPLSVAQAVAPAALNDAMYALQQQDTQPSSQTPAGRSRSPPGHTAADASTTCTESQSQDVSVPPTPPFVAEPLRQNEPTAGAAAAAAATVTSVGGQAATAAARRESIALSARSGGRAPLSIVYGQPAPIKKPEPLSYQ